MARLSDQQMFDKLTTSECYVNTVDTTDKNKVKRAKENGVHSPSAGSKIGQVAQELGVRVFQATPKPPPPPPDPPPVQTIRVAPRATNMEGGSNVQYCMFNPDGTLRPGVREIGHNKYTDESGAIYSESKQDSSIRDESYFVNGLPGSRSMDGRSPCKCLEDAGYPGDPAKNTGAWHV